MKVIRAFSAFISASNGVDFVLVAPSWAEIMAAEVVDPPEKDVVPGLIVGYKY